MQMTEKEAFQKLVSATKTDTNPLDRQNIQKYLFSLLKQVESFLTPVSSLKKEDFNKLREQYTVTSATWQNSVKDIFDRFNKNLLPSALESERQQFFSSIIRACTESHALLKQIDAHIDTILDNETIELKTIRTSEAYILGILRKIDILSTWAMYVFSTMTMVRSNMSYVIPKYRLDYIANNVDKVVETVNEVYKNKLNAKEILNKLKESRSSMTDQRLLGPTGIANQLATSVLNKLNPFSIFSFIDFIISMLRWPFEAWQDWLYKRYLRNVELKNWMEQHVALLRMEQSQLSPNDPKYHKIQKAIEVYDWKIIEYSKKIEEFEKEN